MHCHNGKWDTNQLPDCGNICLCSIIFLGEKRANLERAQVIKIDRDSTGSKAVRGRIDRILNNCNLNLYVYMGVLILAILMGYIRDDEPIICNRCGGDGKGRRTGVTSVSLGASRVLIPFSEKHFFLTNLILIFNILGIN